MYPDSNIIIRVILHIYVFVTGYLLLIFRRSPWPVHVPPHILVLKAERTDREDYRRERNMYRKLHYFVRKGEILNKTHYYYYSLIAKKYGWPYIKETYDNLADIRIERHFPHLPRHLMTKVKKIERDGWVKIYWASDLIVCLFVSLNFWLNDAAHSDPFFVNLLAPLYFAVVFQIFFIPAFYVTKLFIRLSRLPS